MKNLKLIIMLVVAVALAAVVFQNRAPVKTHFLMITLEMPQILLLLLTVAGGFCLGLLTALTMKSKHKDKP